MSRAEIMTDKDKEMYNVISLYIAQNGYSPTVRELCAMTGARSTSTVHSRLKKLENLGNTVASMDSTQVELCVLKYRESDAEPAIFASVYMALPKSDKLEHVIQKATELGASEIVTFPSARCVSRPDDKSLKKKLERWQKIAASAAEQSGRGRIPQVLVLSSYAAALERAAQADKALIFYENEHATTLHQGLDAGEFRSISLLSGPEGGWEEEEIQQAQNAGLQVCTLGRRILRCETAPLCALSAVMYHAGEF